MSYNYSVFKLNESRKSISGGCYLTTIICNILGMNDHSIYLDYLRRFRDDYMLNNPETYPMLIEYDLVGPKIAEALNNDPCKFTIANDLFQKHILPIIEDINYKNFDVAIKKYENMTNKLKNFYQIDTTIDRKLDINIKTLGKART